MATHVENLLSEMRKKTEQDISPHIEALSLQEADQLYSRLLEAYFSSEGLVVANGGLVAILKTSFQEIDFFDGNDNHTIIRKGDKHLEMHCLPYGFDINDGRQVEAIMMINHDLPGFIEKVQALLNRTNDFVGQTPIFGFTNFFMARALVRYGFNIDTVVYTDDAEINCRNIEIRQILSNGMFNGIKVERMGVFGEWRVVKRKTMDELESRKNSNKLRRVIQKMWGKDELDVMLQSRISTIKSIVPKVRVF